MSVSLISSPPSLSFSADLISARFSSTGYLAQVGVYSINKLSGVLTHGNGVVTTFKYGGVTVVMTATTDPDDSGTQYQCYTPPLITSIETIAAYFQANPQLSQDFDITTNSEEIIFSAKKTALGFDFKNSPGDGLNLVEGLPEIKQPNYSTFFKLWLENSENNNFDLIYSTNLQLLPGTDGESKAIIGDKIHTVISQSIRKNLPEQPSDPFIQCKNSCRKYYFEFAESYGDPLEVKKLYRSDTFTVLHGGLSMVGRFNFSVSSLLFPSGPESDRFLRQGGSYSFTRSNQPQFLYFFNNRSAKSVKLVIEFHSSTGEVHTEEISTFSMLEKRKYAFNVCYNNVYNDFLPGKNISFYKVYLMDGTEKSSETLTYYLDYSQRKFIRYFVNWSSLGALDSRVCYGKGESEFELQTQTANRMLTSNSELQMGSSFNFNTRLKRNFKVATGFLTKRNLYLNADFFLSNFKYRFISGMMLPIEIKSGKIPELKDGENLIAQIFEYSYHFEDHAYTEGDSDNAGISLDNFLIPSALPSIYYPGVSGNLADEILQRLANLEQENLIDGNGT